MRQLKYPVEPWLCIFLTFLLVSCDDTQKRTDDQPDSRALQRMAPPASKQSSDYEVMPFVSDERDDETRSKSIASFGDALKLDHDLDAMHRHKQPQLVKVKVTFRVLN